jgi:hypothetical protein
MFRDATTHYRQRTRLHVIHGGRQGSSRTAQGDSKMNEYKFTRYPSNSAVASGITMLVSAWFLVAAGAILSDPASPYTQRKQAQALALQHAAVAPASAGSPAAIPAAAHLTVLVEAHRSTNL